MIFLVDTNDWVKQNEKYPASFDNFPTSFDEKVGMKF